MQVSVGSQHVMPAHPTVPSSQQRLWAGLRQVSSGKQHANTSDPHPTGQQAVFWQVMKQIATVTPQPTVPTAQPMPKLKAHAMPAPTPQATPAVVHPSLQSLHAAELSVLLW
jgi:hypothetical protein